MVLEEREGNLAEAGHNCTFSPAVNRPKSSLESPLTPVPV